MDAAARHAVIDKANFRDAAQVDFAVQKVEAVEDRGKVLAGGGELYAARPWPGV
jgi:hypothetical protein